MGGRGSTLRSKQETLKHEKEKPKKDSSTGVYKVSNMTVDQADNNSANPNYLGGQQGRAEYNANRRAANRLLKEYYAALGDKLDSKGMKQKTTQLAKQYNAARDRATAILDGNKAYSINCQRSVIAYELRRRGYMVEAEPNSTGRGRDSGYKEYERQVERKGEFATMPMKTKDRPAAVDKLMLEKLKPGERAIISWGWRKARSGHTINVERTASGLLYVDAQSGRKAKTMGKYLGKRLFDRLDKRGFKWMRSDNADFDISKLVSTKALRAMEVR